MHRFLIAAFVFGCGNDLPPPGACHVATTGGPPAIVPVALVGRPASFDDLRYAPALGKVIAVPEGTGRLYLVDPETLAVTMSSAPGGSASADASATTIYIADRGTGSIVAIDAVTLAQTAARPAGANPDYVRVAPTTGEVWVTLPGRDTIAIFDPRSLEMIGSVAISGSPEGLTFDAAGRAYTQTGGKLVAIDVGERTVVGEWDTGCGSSHGFPQVDDAYGLVIAGCGRNGGAAVMTRDGDLRAGFEAGGDAAILAYDGTGHRLFLRGDPGTTLDILDVCNDGGTSVHASETITSSGHGATADDRGNAWICDATAGGLLHVDFGATSSASVLQRPNNEPPGDRDVDFSFPTRFDADRRLRHQ